MRMMQVGYAAACLMLAGCLSGCFAIEPPVGGAAIKRDGDSLLIALCVSVADADGKVSYRDLSIENEWIDAWTFDVEGDLEAGTILSSDPEVTRPFVGEVRETIPSNPGVDVLVQVNPEFADSDSDWVFADFRVPDSGLSEEVWLQQDGSTTTQPCP
jgi:hypothetical protein